MYDDNSNNKCDSTLTKRYKYDDLMVAVIGLSTRKTPNTPCNSLVFLCDL